MADIQMPGYLDYGSMMNMNPIAAGMAMDQASLARQFADESYKQQQNTTQKGYLENQFAEQDNPNKVQERVLTNQQKDILNQGYSLDNQGKVIRNQDAGLELASKQDLYGDSQKLKHATIARTLSDEELTQASNHALTELQKARLARDAEGVKHWGSVMDLMVGAVASKAADRVQSAQTAAAANASHERQAATHAAATKYSADVGAKSRNYVADQHTISARTVARIKQTLEQRERELASMEQTPDVIAEREEVARARREDNPMWANTVGLKDLTHGSVQRHGEMGSGATGVTKGGIKYQIVPSQ